MDGRGSGGGGWSSVVEEAEGRTWQTADTGGGARGRWREGVCRHACILIGWPFPINRGASYCLNQSEPSLPAAPGEPLTHGWRVREADDIFLFFDLVFTKWREKMAASKVNDEMEGWHGIVSCV